MVDREPITSSPVDVGVLLQQWLAARLDLDADEVVTDHVLLFGVEKVMPDGSVSYRRGRATPMGGVTPWAEDGLILRAAKDLDNED